MERMGPILVVDDEEDLLNLVDLHLRRDGFTTIKARNGKEAIAALSSSPALVILDLMLPDMSGKEVCRKIRLNPKTSHVPVIMLSARGEEIDRIVGFEVGADDYVVKSNFSARELALRVRAVLRRQAAVQESEDKASADGPAQMSFGALVIDEAAHRVWVQGDEVALTATEFSLICTLARRAGRVQTRPMLLVDVWDSHPNSNTRTVDTHVKRLREKLGAASRCVETVRGKGYRFNPDFEV